MEWFCVRTPLSMEEIELVERRLNIQLPTDYKQMIGPINGGALKDAYVKHPSIGEIAYGRNLALDENAKTNVFTLYGCIMEDKRYFPFASVGNGDYFCFDLQTERVILWLHEYNEIYDICETFTQLLQMMQHDNWKQNEVSIEF